MPARNSMDASRGWGNKGQVQQVKRMEGGSGSGSGYQSGGNSRSGDSSRASSREGSSSRPSQSSRESSQTRTGAPAPPSAKSEGAKTRAYTSDEIERKVALTLAEYIENEDLSEALKDCDEFRPAKESQVVEFCQFALSKVTF